MVQAGVSKLAEIRSPFDTTEAPTKTIFTYDYNLTEADIQSLANYNARLIGGNGAKLQVTTLYAIEYGIYDQLTIQRPSINWITTWMIRSVEHSFTKDGFLSILQATFLRSGA